MAEHTDSLCVVGSLERIAQIRHWLETSLARWHVPEGIVQDLALATTEVCTNIARHGYGQPTTETIRIDLTFTGDRIQVAIMDTAPVFHPPPSVALPTPHLNEGGYGMYLTRQVVDEFRHVPLEPRGNRIILTKSISRPPARNGH